MSDSLKNEYILLMQYQLFKMLYEVWRHCSDYIIHKYEDIELETNPNEAEVDRLELANQDIIHLAQIKQDLNKMMNWLANQKIIDMEQIEQENKISISVVYAQKLNLHFWKLLSKSKPLGGNKQTICKLIFRFITEQFENKYSIQISFDIKLLCVQFYGNIIIDSNILSINQTNIFSYILILQSKLKLYKYFQFQKTQIIKSVNTAIIVETQDKDILIHFIAGTQFQKSVSIILNSTTASQAIQYEYDKSVYNFPPHYEINSKTTFSTSHINSYQNVKNIMIQLQTKNIINKLNAKRIEIYNLI